MKIFKFLALLTISVLLFTGCEKEEITNYAFQEISAPTDVNANFNVSQDDSGEVTITPSGEGAQVFQVYFGDGDDSPVEVAPGETVSYTYDEGEYLVRVVAVGATGLTSEFNQRLLISFNAPENLEVTVDQSVTNPAMVTVSATADFAASFDIYFGDEEDEEPTQLMPDGSVEHTYASPGTYTIRVVARGAGAATTETTVEVVVPEANDPVKLPITFDIPTVNYALGTFNGAEFEVVTNPFLTGENTEENMVGKLTNNGGQFEGGAYNLGEPVDFSGDNKTISMKFYSDQPVSVLMKFEGGETDADRANEVSADHGGTGWEVLSFNFGTSAVKSFIDGDPENGQAFVPTGKYSTLVLFVEIGETTTGTFYFDDIAQESSSTDPLKLPIDFDGSVAYAAATSGVAFEVVTNPNQSGINSTDTKVGSLTNTGSAFEALTVVLDEAIDFSGANKTITMKVYSDIAYPVLFKLETGVNGERANEVEVEHGGTGWEELTFDFNNARKSFVNGDPENGQAFVPTGQYDSFSIFLDFAGTTAGTFYIDDIVQTDSDGSGGGMASTKTSFPVTFETAANGGAAANWSVFENVDNPALEIISNPDMTGNTSATVAKFTARQAGQPFAGTITQLETPFTLNASNSIVKIMVWKSVISDVGIKFENAAGGSTGEIKVANTKIDEWEELTFDFSGVIGDPNNTDITGLVVFPDFNDSRSQDNVVYFDNITLNASGSGGGESSEATVATSLPIDFESNETLSGVFEASQGVTGKPVNNPEMTGNNSNTVYEFTKADGAAWYSGIFQIFPDNIDLSQGTSFSFKFYSPKAGINVRFQLEKEGSDASPNISIDQTVSEANTWVTLTFDFDGIIDVNNPYDKFVIFPEFDDVNQPAGDGSVYYIDDIEQN